MARGYITRAGNFDCVLRRVTLFRFFVGGFFWSLKFQISIINGKMRPRLLARVQLQLTSEPSQVELSWAKQTKLQMNSSRSFFFSLEREREWGDWWWYISSWYFISNCVVCQTGGRELARVISSLAIFLFALAGPWPIWAEPEPSRTGWIGRSSIRTRLLKCYVFGSALKHSSKQASILFDLMADCCLPPIAGADKHADEMMRRERERERLKSSD